MAAILTVILIFLASSLSTFTGVQTRAKDTERNTDLRALQGQLEAYYAQNGYYPTLGDINSPSWRAANMKGLDADALKDPDSTSSQLTTKPSVHSYSYDVTSATGTACNNTSIDCEQFRLTATLDNGSQSTILNVN